MKKIMIAMSGGVDSSVTAYLLKNQGYECCGATMKLYDAEELNISRGDEFDQTSLSSCKTCCSLDDVEDARSVSYKMGMSHHVFNYKDAFRECVIDDFVDCYQRGLTPNPCIRCNKYMKFDKLLLQANVLGYDGIATGHYARIEFDQISQKYKLKKALDLSKDQSYVLYNLDQEQLSKILFPLGELNKTEVRAIAEENDFVNAKKHDSQDICFVPDGDYATMIESYTGKSFESGFFRDMDGNILGRHKGIIHYTIGQRRGLGIASDGRLYVVKIDVLNNTVILGRDEDLFSTEVNISNLHFIDSDYSPKSFRCSAKIRYRMKEQPATVELLENGKAIIHFDEAQRAATPGQTAVFYDGDYVLGGGIISQ